MLVGDDPALSDRVKRAQHRCACGEANKKWQMALLKAGFNGHGEGLGA